MWLSGYIKNTTNLKTHLHRHHADKYEVFLKDDNHNKFEKKKASGRLNYMNLTFKFYSELFIKFTVTFSLLHN